MHRSGNLLVADKSIIATSIEMFFYFRILIVVSWVLFQRRGDCEVAKLMAMGGAEHMARPCIQ